jgi:glycosyltransferase involved in cell wall biosynthesis
MNSKSKSPLNLLFIAADRFPSFRSDLSVLFGNEMVNRGHRIDWIQQSQTPIRRSKKIEVPGGTVFLGPMKDGISIVDTIKRHIFAILHDFKVFQAMRGRSNYDFVIIRDKFLSALLAIIAAKLHGVKVIFWLSYPFPEDSLFQVKIKTARYPLIYWLRGHLSRFFLYKILLPLSCHLFVQTEQMKRNVAIMGIPEKNMTAVPMAVSIEKIPFFGYDVIDKRNRRRRNVVYLGTLARARRMEFLLRAFAHVFRHDNNARLILIGGSENPVDEEFLKKEAVRLGISEATKITGFLPQDKAWEYVKHADVCVSPIYPSPIWDCGSPTKLIEYMAMGKASVANDHPEQRDVISQSDGGICVPYDEQAFAQAILWLFKNPHICKKMGDCGRKYVQDHRNYKKTASFVENKLLELL